MITKIIFPIQERKDLRSISSDKTFISIHSYVKCLVALEFAESYINEFHNKKGVSSKFMNYSEDSLSNQ